DRKCRGSCAPRRGRPQGGRQPADLGGISQTVLGRHRKGRMSFSSAWLTLRAPYDRRARNAAVLDAVAAWAAERPSVAVVDLACWQGSTLRALSERLPQRHPWRPRHERPPQSKRWRRGETHVILWARAGCREKPPDLSVTPVPVDLARD